MNLYLLIGPDSAFNRAFQLTANPIPGWRSLLVVSPDEEKSDLLTSNRSGPLLEVGEVRWGIMFVSEGRRPKT